MVVLYLLFWRDRGGRGRREAKRATFVMGREPSKCWGGRGGKYKFHFSFSRQEEKKKPPRTCCVCLSVCLGWNSSYREHNSTARFRDPFVFWLLLAELRVFLHVLCFNACSKGPGRLTDKRDCFCLCTRQGGDNIEHEISCRTKRGCKKKKEKSHQRTSRIHQSVRPPHCIRRIVRVILKSLLPPNLFASAKPQVR